MKPSLFTVNLLAATSLSSTLIAAPAFAQSSDDDIETLEITATRTPTKIGDIASPVTVITADELAARQTIRLADILATLPGLSIQRAGSVGGQTQLRLRGAEANQTLILIDGVEANDPAAGDEVQLENLISTGVERIEIIRGPQSAVWGSDALAGVINIVTKKGDGPATFGVFAEGGSFGTFRGGVNTSAGGKGWHFSGGASYVDAAGVNVSRQGDEDDGYQNFTVNARGGFDITDTISFDGSIRHTDSENEGDGADFINTGLPVDTDNQNDTRNTFVAGGLTGKFLDGAWTQTLRLTYLDTAIDNFANDAPAGSTGGERFSIYADARIALADDQALTLLFDHEEADFEQEGIASPFGDPNQTQERSTTGYGIDYVGTVLQGLTLTGSLRRDENDAFDDFTSWRVGASYRAEETGTRFFGNIARGQKAPTFIELFGFFADQFLGNPDLEPERSTNYEIGVEQKFLDDRVTARVTYFYADLENEINGFIFDPDTFLFTAGNVDGQSTREGVEFELSAAVNEQLSLRANYAYLDAEEPDGFGGTQEEIRRPRHSADLFINYLPIEDLRFTLNANYTGEAIDTFFPPFPQPVQRVTLDDYLLVNITGDYQIREGLALYGRVENLFDANYEDIFGFATPGIGAFAGVRVQF